MSVWWAEHAWLGEEHAEQGVLIKTAGGTITRVDRNVLTPPEGATILRGLTLPGLVNAHSHAFHRALRGRTQAERGTFFTWRERMYNVASRLEPDTYYALARATFTEMLLAGITTVGEFHYLHHRPDGTPYASPTAMAMAVARAATDAGIRLTLLDTCYLRGGFGLGPDDPHVPLSPAQLRFGDGTAIAWSERATLTHQQLESATVRVGAAVHSVRAVPAEDLRTVADWAHAHTAPIHVHVSEQPAENEDCQNIYGCSPTELLARHGVLDHLASAVHATHLTVTDVQLLATNGASACFCVTTERDLADGIGPAAQLAAAGVNLTVGSDSHAVIDLFEETRGIELGERVRSGHRGYFRACDLLESATSRGAASLGWPELGRLIVGALADFVTVSPDSVRMAGAEPKTFLETVVFAAVASDVHHVVVNGVTVVEKGTHVRYPNVVADLTRAITSVCT
ncbi:formimidoylglutamate deiminase [Cryobacterium sp. CG_9.6]|uniref:formimidoylglutamate deiminase n=1 Tax=Cryobacterium sp. CG_9.6 TaxID=2760710 RepID=UPI00247441C9|nr:formimidoylglutamate deiminase [Cryobacterium sp. CG_9.6]MDH6235819.1 formiminoglutamate deiminase [Cryobacterium sp. CG_9.6]